MGGSEAAELRAAAEADAAALRAARAQLRDMQAALDEARSDRRAPRAAEEPPAAGDAPASEAHGGPQKGAPDVERQLKQARFTTAQV